MNVEEHFEKNGYRLPTEAEWEYACRAGTRTSYYWGTTADSTSSTRYEWSHYNSKPSAKTNTVAGLLPNPLHLYDMAGNQLEWCNDRYAEYTSDFQENPRHASGYPDQKKRVCRSGPHGVSSDSLTSSARYISEPDLKIDANAVYGIRVVLPANDKLKAAAKNVNGVFRLLIDQELDKVSLTGQLYGGPLPKVFWDTVRTVGECRLTVPKVPFCPDCRFGSVCVSDNNCQPEPDRITAGMVTVTGYIGRGGKTTSTIIPSSPGIYQPVLDNRPANPPFTEGDIVTLSASGNDSVAGFTVSAKTISKIETSQDTILMSPGEDIHLKWKAAADPED